MRKIKFFEILLFAFFILSYAKVFAFINADCSGSNSNNNSARYGMYNGSCIVYYCKNGVVSKIAGNSIESCGGCSSKGTVKYSPMGTCATCTQTCCDNQDWSECNAGCPEPEKPKPDECPSSQCWNGSKCEKMPSGTGYNGKCYFTYNGCSCNKGSGWSCGKLYQNRVQDGSTSYFGWSGSTGPSGTNRCQPSTLNAFANGTGNTSGPSLCKVQANALGISGTGTWDGSCYIIYYSSVNYTNWLMTLTCKAKNLVCE